MALKTRDGEVTPTALQQLLSQKGTKSATGKETDACTQVTTCKVIEREYMSLKTNPEIFLGNPKEEGESTTPLAHRGKRTNTEERATSGGERKLSDYLVLECGRCR